MAKVQRPRCEFKGAPPHPAIPTYLLVWNLQSGTVMRGASLLVRRQGLLGG
jgi:hypothetical protein